MSVFKTLANAFSGYKPLDDEAELTRIGASDSNSQETSDASAMREISDMKDLSLHEKKCLLVNREINAMGMGTYQWCLWLLCGLGYFLDLLWAMNGGLILQPLVQEFGLTGSQIVSLGVAAGVGSTIGAAFWGIAVDIIGRWWSFNLTVLFSAVFGTAVGGVNSYPVYLILTALSSFGIGGNIPIDTAITLEFIPDDKHWVLPMLSIFQPIGVVVAVGIAYAFIPRYSCVPNFASSNPLPSCNLVEEGTLCCGRANNWGWRYCTFTIGGITATIFVLRFICFRMQESPKFLIYKGRDDAALRSLRYVCGLNKRKCGITPGMFEALTKDHESVHGLSTATSDVVEGQGEQILPVSHSQRLDLGRFKLLFATPAAARLFILLALTYMCDYLGFTIAGGFQPTLIALKDGELNLSIEYTYRSYFAIYTPGALGVILGVYCYDIPSFGKKSAMIVSSALMAASILAFSAVNSQTSNILLNCIEYFFQSMFNALLYAWTPEVFPAPIRGTAAGLCSFFGRLFGIVGPLLAGRLLPEHPGIEDYEKTLYLAGGVTLACVLWLALLPSRIASHNNM